jgi:hypothetical protein
VIVEQSKPERGRGVVDAGPIAPADRGEARPHFLAGGQLVTHFIGQCAEQRFGLAQELLAA